MIFISLMCKQIFLNWYFHFSFETENKITRQEQGQQKNVGEEGATVVQGSYSYTSPEGQVITVNYIADENGFRPTGDHIPAAPAVPEANLKSMGYNQAHGEQVRSQYYQQPLVEPRNNQYLAPPAHNMGSHAQQGQQVPPQLQNRQYLAPQSMNYDQKQGYKY